MNPEAWLKLSPVLDLLLDLSEPQRADYLEQLRREDPQFCEEVESLLGQGPHGLLDAPSPPLLEEIQPTRVVDYSPWKEADPWCGVWPSGTPRRAGRYLIREEIARGGMGAILRAHDPDIQRTLAVKILLPGTCADPNAVRRFSREARITGRLQHPGIPPIHELGRLDNGLPFFAMKLIEGRTLTALLRETGFSRTDSLYVGIFEQICRTLAYAHSQGIIHRDLKPSNIMVGAFGEVQVMDWGLARESRVADSESDDPPTVATPDDEGGTATRAGDVIGTPSYMAPEQARGETDELDERCDVFGLGGILCAVLVGRPPFSGGVLEMVNRSAAGELTEAFDHLGRADADADLILIAKQCLAPRKEDRYRDAGEVADAVTEYRQAARAKLEQAMLDREAARVQAGEERRRRRLTLVLAASLLFLVLGSAGTGLWYQRYQAQRRVRADNLEGLVTRSLDDAEAERQRMAERLKDPDRIHLLLSDLQPWQSSSAAARSHWRKALELADSDPELLEPAVHERMRTLALSLAEDEADEAFARTLDAIRLKHYELRPETIRSADPAGTGRIPRDADYGQLFEGKHWQVRAGDLEELAGRIRRSPTRYVAAAALDDWAQTLLYRTPCDEALIRRLLELSRRVDPEPWRDRFRRWEVWSDPQQLQRIIGELKPSRQSPQILRTAAEVQRYQNQDAVGLLRSALLHYPSDFWLNQQLGTSSVHVRHDESVGAFRAALALRPRSAETLNNFGAVMLEKNDLAAAQSLLSTALECRPDYAAARSNLGLVFHRTGRNDDAIAQFRLALAVDSKDAIAHNNLGIALRDQGKFAEAIESLRSAQRLKPRENRANLLRQYEAILSLRRTEPRTPVESGTLERGLQGTLTEAHPLDFLFKVAHCHRVSHLVSLKANTTYRIDLTGSFDTYLRVEDTRLYLPLAFNDDIRAADLLHSRVVFTPPRDDVYRLVVTSGHSRLTGTYELRLTETVPVGAPTVVRGRLGPNDRFDRDKYFKWHMIPLLANAPCTVTLQSKDFDTRVRLYDATGKKALGFNDSLSPASTRISRIDVTPNAAGTYQVYVSSSRPNQTGEYTLTVQQFAAP